MVVGVVDIAAAETVTDLIVDGSDLETIWIGAVLSLYSAVAFAKAFLTTSFLATADYAAFLAALIALHLFFAAIEIAFRPAALILCLRLVLVVSVGSEPCLSLLYLARCAAAIRFLAANENFLRLPLPVSDGEAAGSL